MSTSSRAVVAAVAAVYGVVVVPALLLGAALMAQQASASTAVAVVECATVQFADYGPGGVSQPVGDEQFSGEQLANAQLIVAVAVERRLPKRAAVLALATAMVESELRNVNHGDRDSLGLFQQRPSQGWGSPEQILNPTYAAGKFYDHLIALPNWETMPTGAAEQAVQRSAYPDRYAPREAAAAELVARFWQGPDNPVPQAPDIALAQYDHAATGCPDKGRGNLNPEDLDPKRLPPGFTVPPDQVHSAAVTYALAQVGKPYKWGAEGPDAFDCSGLTQAAWAHAGVGISRTTATQVHDGVPVGSIAALQPGDLVFIPGADGTPAAPGHVGMYVGNGYMVDAYDETRGVILTTLDSWKSKIVAIRRVAAGDGGGPSTGGDSRL
ncbi:C40 family peptidase [Actinokineospora iranica]|uniref:Cell wall-associated hydrolase, NlpC family n=1 Tax=Actinokineospora iranica TaxID=1271860 RepID=A0A1G6VSK8_9PSEU|nr:C40 family peptidase [Actinokineospora iranica]SDD56413.1 Cell wall-associated hydrolase, NlpC family [Actinokineospora iranica]